MTDRGGRPAATSAHDLAVAAQRLFLENGFEHTNIDDIAAEAGVSRRTFFRYFPSKAEVVWVDARAEFARLRRSFATADPVAPYEDVVVDAVVGALRFPPAHREWAWQRARLVLTVPEVQAHTSRRFADWRDAAAQFAADRSGQPVDAMFPVAVGHAVLAATLAGHQYWLNHPDADLFDALACALRMLLPPWPE